MQSVDGARVERAEAGGQVADERWRRRYGLLGSELEIKGEAQLLDRAMDRDDDDSTDSRKGTAMLLFSKGHMQNTAV